MSFRLKTILGLVLIQAILLLILNGYGFNAFKASSNDELLKRAQTTTALFASTVHNAVLASDLAALESFVDEILTNRDIVYARILARDVVLAQAGDRNALAKPFLGDSHFEDVTDNVFDNHADISLASKTYGRVELGFSTKPMEEVLTAARHKLFIFDTLAMTLVTIFSYLLGLYLTRGLATLKNASRRVAAGHLGFQIAVQGRDELAQTAAAFNDMSSKLAALDEEHRRAESEIKLLNTELEKRVELRTTQLASLNKKLEYQSLHDALTLLPNRTLYHDRLDQAILIARRNTQSFALMALDLDRFKEINDSLGHHAGDLVLQETAERLKTALRHSDTVARMGGDEFALLLPTATSAEEAAVVAKKILLLLNEPLVIDGRSINIGASIGIALFPQHGEDATTLVRRSDSAMYVAKRTHAGYMLYDSSLDAEDAERLTLHMDLRHAIGNHQLVLHYQPKVDFSTRQVSGVEALVRWQHPRLGLIYPDAFIPIAEKAGMMKPFTLAVIELALIQSSLWTQAGLNLTIAINISAINLQDPQFPDDMAAMLHRHQVLPANIELEVTETAIMSEPLKAIENIKKLSGMGLQIAIDDFGTGYSSMAYLRKLLVAKIKIDKSFVMDMHNNKNDEVIVRSTVDLGHNLGLTVVAEGVETQGAWDKLKELGCDSAQGYFMGRPVAPAELEKWVRQSPWGLAAPDAGASEKAVQVAGK